MTDRIIDLEFGPYATEHGVYIIALVQAPNGEQFVEEIYYDNLDECYEDISDLLTEGAVDLEDDELEGDEDYE